MRRGPRSTRPLRRSAHGANLIPPNTFARYVESGSQGLKPHGAMTVIRDASSSRLVEDVAAEIETTVEPGDVFALLDVPYDEYGKEALGTMWHPGAEDARSSVSLSGSPAAAAP
jgi:hypothetical protein